MTSRRLLVIPYFYPPFPGSGNRWPAMAKYLRRAGHSVTIVATAAFGRLSDDAEHGVVRVPDLRSVKSLRRVFRRGEIAAVGTQTLETPPSRLLTRLIVPDVHIVSWTPAALFAVQRLLRRGRFDCLITSSPLESNHLIGPLLGSSRPAWIADFRDGWGFEPLREPFATRAQRGLDAWLEERVVLSADVAVCATRPIAEDLARRFRVAARHVPNGWDPEAAPELEAERTRSRERPTTLVYTGALSGSRDPTPLLRALRVVDADEAVAPMRLVLAGRLTAAERDLIASNGVNHLVEHRGTLDRREALALQRSGDALILLTSRNSSEAGGKLYEYLGARRPIVALAEGNEAERIVRETNTGTTVPPDDVEGIATALRRVASGELERMYAPRNLDAYTYPAPAERMAKAVEAAIAKRDGRAHR